MCIKDHMLEKPILDLPHTETDSSLGMGPKDLHFN